METMDDERRNGEQTCARHAKAERQERQGERHCEEAERRRGNPPGFEVDHRQGRQEHQGEVSFRGSPRNLARPTALRSNSEFCARRLPVLVFCLRSSVYFPGAWACVSAFLTSVRRNAYSTEHSAFSLLTAAPARR